VLKALELAGADVEEGCDAVPVDVEALGDQVVVGSEHT
jgi:hypothetical protein